MSQQKKTNDDKIIEDFMRSQERMEKFIREDLDKIKSPIKEKFVTFSK